MNERAYEILQKHKLSSVKTFTEEELLTVCDGDSVLAEQVRCLLRDIRVSQEVAEQAFKNESASGNQILSMSSVLGRYKLLECIGAGGFGKVWKAYDPELDRYVAIKVANVERINYADAFLKEARNVAKLNHPNIVPVYDFGMEGDYCFIVSRLIEGCDLATLLRDQHRPCQDEAVQMISSIANGLAAAHALGLVHRDVKPSNILVDRQGGVFLTDFGIAASRGELLSLHGSSSGTLAYMSPEQIRGEGSKIDPRSDIFSLGVVLYELLVGERPFVGDDSFSLCEEIKENNPWPPHSRNSNVSAALSNICLRAIDKLPENRFDNATGFAEALQQISGDKELKHPSSHRKSYALIVSIMVFVVCGWIVFGKIVNNPKKESLSISTPTTLPSSYTNSIAKSTTNGIISTTKEQLLLLEHNQYRSFAVFEFENHSTDPDRRNWGKALRDMLMTDLARAPELVVVERARLNEVLSEHKLSAAKFIDPETALQLGRGVAAHWVLTGAITVDGPRIRLDARVVSVEKGTIAFADFVENESSIFSLQRLLMQKLTRNLNLLDSEEIGRLYPVTHHVDESAFSRFAAAVAARDEGALTDASAKLRGLLRDEPDFLFARYSLTDLEKSVMEDLSRLKIRRLQQAGSIGDALRQHLDNQIQYICEQNYTPEYFAALIAASAHAGLLGDYAREATLLKQFWRDFTENIPSEKSEERIEEINNCVREHGLFFQNEVDGGYYYTLCSGSNSVYLREALQESLSWPLYAQIWPFNSESRVYFGIVERAEDETTKDTAVNQFEESLPITPCDYILGLLHGANISHSDLHYHFMKYDDRESDKYEYAEYISIIQLRIDMLRYLLRKPVLSDRDKKILKERPGR